MAKVFKTLKKKARATPLVGVILDSLKSENPRQNAPSIQAVLDNMTPPQSLLINGDFNCWQRGESFNITGDEAFHYTADMWCVYAGTGQTVTVKKTTDGLQFSGTSVIMQRMSPLKVGQKYVFLCKVDGDVKTLSITGGTYTENNFLKYNKSGSYEQFQIKSNGTTNIANARLWEGDTIYPIIEEDKDISLMKCQRKIKKIFITSIARANSNNSFELSIRVGEMDSTPSIIKSDNLYLTAWYVGITGDSEGFSKDLIKVNFADEYLNVNFLSQYSLTANTTATITSIGYILLSCEPL